MTFSAKSQSKVSNRAIANIKAGYHCDLLIDRLNSQIDSISSQHARQMLLVSSLNSYISSLKKNNDDLNFNKNSLNKRLAILEEKNKRNKRKLKVWQIGAGVLIAFVGFSLK